MFMNYLWIACTPLLGKNPTLDDNPAEDITPSLDAQRILPTTDTALFFGKELHVVNNTLYISAPSEVSEIYSLDLNNSLPPAVWSTAEAQQGHHLTGINQLFWSTPSSVQNSDGTVFNASPQEVIEAYHAGQNHLIVLSDRALFIDSTKVLETAKRASLMGFCQGKILLYSPLGEYDVVVYDLSTQEFVSQRLRSGKPVRQSIECFKFDEQWTWAIAGSGSIELLDTSNFETVYQSEFEEISFGYSMVSPAPDVLLIGAPSKDGFGAVYELRAKQDEVSVKFTGTVPDGEFGSSLTIEHAAGLIFVSSPLAEQGEVWRYLYE